MAWSGTPEQCRKLLSALREAADTYTLAQLATSLAADRKTRILAVAFSKRPLSPIHRTTLERWIEGLDANQESLIPDEAVQALQGKSYALLQIVYEFLERSADFRTSLYNPAHALPEGAAVFLDAYRETLRHLRFDRLSKLDGTYQLYRPAWTTPERTDRVLLSRLEIETVAGLTRFREDQDCRDDARGGMPVQETDFGIVFASGTNLFLLGFGHGEFRVKFFAVHAWWPPIDQNKPVYELKGTLLGAAGEGPHPGVRFIAYRSDQPETLRSCILPASQVEPEIASWIGCNRAASP